MSRSRRRQAGMTLIEVLVSMLIFSFGILGMVGLLARATKISVDADDRNRASLFANEVAAAMWTARSVTLSPVVTTALNAKLGDVANGGLTGGAFTITPIPGAVNARGAQTGATITVTWTPVGRPEDQQQTSTYTTQVVIE